MNQHSDAIPSSKVEFMVDGREFDSKFSLRGCQYKGSSRNADTEVIVARDTSFVTEAVGFRYVKVGWRALLSTTPPDLSLPMLTFAVSIPSPH